jgi:Holliday junction resolvase
LSAAKGDRRERQAVEIYERAGYEVERATGGGSHSPDFFDLYDLIAIGGDEGVDLVQVKANGARGIESFCQETVHHASHRGVAPMMLVCYDREGWRLVIPAGRDSHATAVDEREMDCAMGEGVVEYLRGESDGE